VTTYHHTKERIQVGLQRFRELDVPKLGLLLAHGREALVRGHDLALYVLGTHEFHWKIVLKLKRVQRWL
jgi:hypothetical protein